MTALRTSGPVTLAAPLRALIGSGSIPERLVLGSLVAYAGVFGLLLSVGRPGLGLGQGFYLPIALAALATGAMWGTAAGVGALVLYEAGLLIPGQITWSTVVAPATGIRLASYIAAGATVGYFAQRGRGMLAASLHLLDDLLALAKRDPLTATFTSRGFEAAINRRLSSAATFVLLIGELSENEKDALRRLRIGRDERVRALSRLIASRLDDVDEFGRFGEMCFAVLSPASTPAGARDKAVALENAMHAAGCELTFGWAFRPGDGTDLLTLHRAAIDRLHARQVVRGDWVPTPTSAGLVERLAERR